MPKITYIAADGTQATIDAPNGLSVMQAAVNNGIPGIVAECGGACSCATCHVHVDPGWYDRLPPPQGVEQEMLEFANGRDQTSRLSCQIKLTDELDGLIVRTPASQY